MLYYELDRDLQTFPLHLFSAVSQLSAFKKCKQNLKSSQVVVIADFAENYKCRQWSEEQACYYVRNSVTLHPLVIVFSEGSEVKRDSVVILSDDLSHDHAAVKSFIQVLSQHISMTYPHISELIIWSDGCSAQYKSRLPMMNLSQCFGTHYNITWNFFGSRHGKGESDGESAVCKSYLDTSVKSEQQTIHDAHSAFKFLEKSDRNKPDGPSRRHFYFVISADIQTICQLSPLTKDVLAIFIHHAVGGGPHAIAHLMNVNIETSHTEFLNILVSLLIVFNSIFYRCFSQISIMFVWWLETLFACSYNRLTYKRIFFPFC